MREIWKRIKSFIKELLKSDAERQQEWRASQERMCKKCVVAGCCPKDCSICSWGVRE